MLSVLIYAVQHCAVDSTTLEPATVYTVIKRIEFHFFGWAAPRSNAHYLLDNSIKMLQTHQHARHSNKGDPVH